MHGVRQIDSKRADQ